MNISVIGIQGIVTHTLPREMVESWMDPALPSGLLRIFRIIRRLLEEFPVFAMAGFGQEWTLLDSRTMEPWESADLPPHFIVRPTREFFTGQNTFAVEYTSEEVVLADLQLHRLDSFPVSCLWEALLQCWPVQSVVGKFAAELERRGPLDVRCYRLPCFTDHLRDHPPGSIDQLRAILSSLGHCPWPPHRAVPFPPPAPTWTELLAVCETSEQLEGALLWILSNDHCMDAICSDQLGELLDRFGCHRPVAQVVAFANRRLLEVDRPAPGSCHWARRILAGIPSTDPLSRMMHAIREMRERGLNPLDPTYGHALVRYVHKFAPLSAWASLTLEVAPVDQPEAICVITQEDLPVGTLAARPRNRWHCRNHWISMAQMHHCIHRCWYCREDLLLGSLVPLDFVGFLRELDPPTGVLAGQSVIEPGAYAMLDSDSD